jgi:hypothetical protein
MSPNPPSGVVMAKIRDKLLENLSSFVIAGVIALLTVFSDRIVGDIKFAMNRADLRTTRYETVAATLSNHVYATENVAEYYEKGWTDKASVEMLGKWYNETITELRKQEFVTLALLHKYWDEDDVERFSQLMTDIRNADATIHDLNPEATAIANGTKKTADPAVTKPIVDRLKPLIQRLRTSLTAFLTSLL